VIVVDTNVIAYLMLKGERTSQAEAVFNKDSDWVAPYLWRSEFRNILALYLRQGYITLINAKLIVKEAESLMHAKECEVQSMQVLDLVESSKCSSYDCEFVVLAQQLGVPLVTSDKKLLTEFPSNAVSMDVFIF
jgi:predicted nucleic acid-binding protein